MNELSNIEIYEILSKMFPNARCELNYRNVFELTISTVLSAQTTDDAVNKITPKLFEKYPDAFALAKADIEDVKSIIKRIGLYQNKATNIIKLANELVNNYNGEVPCDFEKLVLLPGIGRKTANVVLSEGFNIPRIAVDTHVLRVSNRLNLLDTESKTLEYVENPYVIETKLMEIYPEEIWSDVHLKLLFFGRYFCKAKKPNCSECFNFKNCKYDKKYTS